MALTELTDLIQDQVGHQEEWTKYGGTTSSLKEINRNLLVKTTPKSHRELAKLLAMLREIRAVQIAVEARFLLVDQNFLDDVGLDVDLEYNLGGKWTPIKIAQDSYGVTNAPATSVPGRFTPGALSPPGTFNVPAAGSGGVSTGFASSSRSLDLGVSYLDDLKVSLMVRASQQSRRSISLSAPRVTFFNGASAQISVQTEVSYLSTLTSTPESPAVPVPDTISSGVTLSVEGTASADRRYVTLSLTPTLNSIDQIRQISFTTSNTSTGGGTGNTNNNNNNSNTGTTTTLIEFPTVSTTDIQTTVSVPDKGTLLLGGQRIIGEVEIEAGVPVLSKIPIINRIFTNRSFAKDERTLLILVKPTIIIQNEEEQNLFPGLLKNAPEENANR